jgi:hypothetical protein
LPVESFVVQKLANGNWEVKEGFVFEYFKWLAKARLLQIKLDECEKKR